MIVDSKESAEEFADEVTFEQRIIDNSIINVDKWGNHKEKVNQIFTLYKDMVNPLVSVYNALENSFPVGVINELRDVFSHLTRSLTENDDKIIDQQLDKAQRHMKRAILDAFKYASMAYSKVYDDFKESYKNVDLSYVNNGELVT